MRSAVAINDAIKDDAAANAEWRAENMEGAVCEVQTALEEMKREEEAELAELASDDSANLEASQ